LVDTVVDGCVEVRTCTSCRATASTSWRSAAPLNECLHLIARVHLVVVCGELSTAADESGGRTCTIAVLAHGAGNPASGRKGRRKAEEH